MQAQQPIENESNDLESLVSLLRDRRVVVLTGAGVSTASGIPDYRGPETRRRARSPIRFADYIASEEKRARYWARSMVGWERFSAARPNVGHQALASMERDGVIDGIITQNVDRLHHRAGSEKVVELHGALEETGCLDCGAVERRADLQARLLAANPRVVATQIARLSRPPSVPSTGTPARGVAGSAPAVVEYAPDGDAELPAEALEGFEAPSCLRCGGTLKPKVVFFGENVRPATLESAYALFDAADVLLVVGSSLAVFSGYRFVRRAKDRGMPVAIVNLGESRGDTLADVRVEADCAALLPRLATSLTS